MKDYAKSFYLSQSWRACRDAYFRKQNGVCERCGNAGDIVHHKCYINPDNINNPKITLNFDNLELLCQDCHNKEHMSNRKEKRKNKINNTRYSVDDEGNILPPTSKNKIPP